MPWHAESSRILPVPENDAMAYGVACRGICRGMPWHMPWNAIAYVYFCAAFVLHVPLERIGAHMVMFTCAAFVLPVPLELVNMFLWDLSM